MYHEVYEFKIFRGLLGKPVTLHNYMSLFWIIPAGDSHHAEFC